MDSTCHTGLLNTDVVGILFYKYLVFQCQRFSISLRLIFVSFAHRQLSLFHFFVFLMFYESAVRDTHIRSLMFTDNTVSVKRSAASSLAEYTTQRKGQKQEF